ncbi:MAG: exodeoxyribonuclease I [Salinisphaera sp.]|uniref:exodeoxyribonuclease I n=1 Tax=Salinisphaera sp. TaxID=1914330 RepID=UPI003C7D5927
MAEPTFFWHDYETFGANPKRDKPAQFAGIRTDRDFNIIGDPVVLYCKPPLDMLGHPEATLITGITPQYAAEHGVPEPEFIETIVAEMAKPGTCSVGYNNLQFDDEVTRHTLWRNFFDPYAREWQNDCSRWDIINMVRLTYALRPNGIEWPMREDGKPSFKLDQLAPANNLAQERAHDALSDVHATIGLAKLIRDKQPRLYDYVLNHRDKASARQLLDMDTRKPALHVTSKFPAENGCLSPVMPIAQHPSNKNCIIVYDLRVDPAPLLELAPDEIFDRIFTPSEDLPENTPRIALKGVHLNKCPVLAPFEMMRETEAARLNLDINQCRRHWKAIHDRLAEVEAKATAVFDARVFDAESDAEAALYDGFVSNDDRKRADAVRATAPAELADGAIVFADNRLNELLFRYRARHFPDSLADAERDDWNNWVAKRLEFAPDGGLTLDEYDEVVAALMERVQGDPARLQLLLDLKAWGDKLRASL